MFQNSKDVIKSAEITRSSQPSPSRSLQVAPNVYTPAGMSRAWWPGLLRNALGMSACSCSASGCQQAHGHTNTVWTVSPTVRKSLVSSFLEMASTFTPAASVASTNWPWPMFCSNLELEARPAAQDAFLWTASSKQQQQDTDQVSRDACHPRLWQAHRWYR